MRLAGLLVIWGLSLVCSAQTTDNEYFLMKFDWNPTSCNPPNTPCLRAPFKAFTTYSLQVYSTDQTVQVYECATTVTDAAATISSETEQELNCIFINSAVPEGSSNAGLWNDVYTDTGACTTIDPREYFRLITLFYNTYNPNVLMGEYAIAPPTVDRDAFLAKIQLKNGKRGWIECDPKTRNLETVVVCLGRKPPYELRDCPFDPANAGATSNGLNCQGLLNLPVTTPSTAAINTPAQCQPYILQTDNNTTASPPSPVPPVDPLQSPSPVPMPTPPSPPPDDGGSSVPIGAIVGGVLGGLALIAAVVLGVMYMRRKRSRESSLPNTAPAPSTNGTNGGANGLPPYTYAGPFAGADPTFASTPPPGSMAMGAAAASIPAAAFATRDTGSASYPSTPISDLGGLSFRPSGGSAAAAAALTSDPLLQYIQSTLSGTSQTSRGSLKSWELMFEDITVERPIGEGSWGRVYKGTYHETQVAVKVLLDNTSGAGANTQSTLVSTNGTVMARLEQEAALMSNLHHPNVVHLLGVCIYPAAIVTEYCARGSLTAVLSAGRASPERAAELTWSRRISMVADCCRGMLYLHSRRPPIIHRDLKSANLLVTASWKLKVSDFNLSKIMEDTTRSTSMQAMNPRWLSPEVLAGSAATLASDVFAMGVILWELLTWELPWGTANPWGIVNQINAGNRLPVPPSAELPGPGSGNWDKLDAYLALMNRCWAQRPEDRPTFGEVMAEMRNIDPAAVEAAVQ